MEGGIQYNLEKHIATPIAGTPTPLAAIPAPIRLAPLTVTSYAMAALRVARTRGARRTSFETALRCIFEIKVGFW